ncbi:HlyD family secretion protein [Anaerosinus massiliensis]|uniref:hypothetical protein n=1 Tax=Massilibacillus massiliensis TaxID=1806837 RepID=UPI000AB8D853|nr:hypothetical protein [Massilibacillus massiliensis]
MLQKKTWIILVVLLLTVTGVWKATASSLIEQRSVLSGEVVSTIAVGTTVSEGTELVRVTTLAGSATAARATTAGIIREITVQKGSKINSGDVVARIEAR